jgi:hypothetical protein
MVGYYADILLDMDHGVGIVVLTTGPGEPRNISQYALRLVWAGLQGSVLPDFPLADPYHVAENENYAGVFHCEQKEFVLSPKGQHLYLEYEGESVLLEPRGPACFLVPHPAFELFLLRFARKASRDESSESLITEAFHGPDWYIRSDYVVETSFELPSEWSAYTGHYRSHNPWLPNFRVVCRCGQLILIFPGGEEEPLLPLTKDYFRVGDDPLTPEFIHFDLLIEGKAQRADLSGGVYCRMFTP